MTTTCKIEIDSLTKKSVYTSADILPQNEGGQDSLFRSFRRIKAGNVAGDYSPTLVVAFIVDTNGIIIGERILTGNIEIGQQILNVIKSFKWKPAKCQGKNIDMLYKFPVIIEVREE